MLPKCIVFNRVAVFKTPACAKKDRNVQFSEIHHVTIVTARSGLRLGSTKRVSIELSMEQTRRTMKPLVVEKVSKSKPFIDSIKLPNR